MASNPGRIPAGGKDKISVVVHTKNRGGRNLNKRFAVYTNDPKKSHVNLTVAGTVRGYVHYSPKYIRFDGQEGQKLSRTIKIIPYEAFPLKIKTVSAKEGKHIRYELKPLPRQDGPAGYQLIVHNTMTSKGNYRDSLIIETGIEHKPKLVIPVSGWIREAPPQAKKSNP